MILVMDTALGACAVGLWHDGVMLAEERVIMSQGHAEALMPMIERVMRVAGAAYTDLDRIGVTVGPGSFTGVRVGLATARGLAMAAGKPAIGVTTTEALAAMVDGQPVVAAIDSKRGDVFAQVFGEDGTARTEPMNIAFEKLREHISVPCVVVGDVAERAATHIGADAHAVPDSSFCILAHVARLIATRVPAPMGPLPLYVRPPDVTLSPGGGALRP